MVSFLPHPVKHAKGTSLRWSKVKDLIPNIKLYGDD